MLEVFAEYVSLVDDAELNRTTSFGLSLDPVIMLP
jgi:hypothetical protein